MKLPCDLKMGFLTKFLEKWIIFPVFENGGFSLRASIVGFVTMRVWKKRLVVTSSFQESRDGLFCSLY